MPRIVNTTPATAPVAGARDRYGRGTVRPPVDWTGIQFKATSELTVDLNHEGRISDPVMRRQGFALPTTKHTIKETVPGVGDGWRHSGHVPYA